MSAERNKRVGRPIAYKAQHDVWALVARGYQDKEIAHELGVTIGVVRGHVRSLIKQANMNNRTQLALEWWGDAWRKEPG